MSTPIALLALRRNHCVVWVGPADCGILFQYLLELSLETKEALWQLFRRQ